MFYWVTFEDAKSGTVEASDEGSARERAEEHGAVVSVARLPYPAQPRIAVDSDCPSFCYSPRECRGRGSCPKGYACSS